MADWHHEWRLQQAQKYSQEDLLAPYAMPRCVGAGQFLEYRLRAGVSEQLVKESNLFRKIEAYGTCAAGVLVIRKL